MMRRGRTAPLLVAASLLLPAGFARGAEIPDVERGRALYENHCVVCHTPKVHRRVPRLPLDLQDLRRIVSTWAREQNLVWSRDDVEDVVQYLNQTYYGVEQ